MFLKKVSFNTYQPPYPSDQAESDKIKIGDEVRVTKDRNPDFHRKGMALIRMLYENQDKVTNEEVFRKLMIIDAGFFDEAVNNKGVVVPIPRSLAFDAMDGIEFEKFYSALLDVAVIKLQAAPEVIQRELENFM